MHGNFADSIFAACVNGTIRTERQQDKNIDFLGALASENVEAIKEHLRNVSFSAVFGNEYGDTIEIFNSQNEKIGEINIAEFTH